MLAFQLGSVKAFPTRGSVIQLIKHLLNTFSNTFFYGKVEVLEKRLSLNTEVIFTFIKQTNCTLNVVNLFLDLEVVQLRLRGRQLNSTINLKLSLKQSAKLIR